MMICIPEKDRTKGSTRALACDCCFPLQFYQIIQQFGSKLSQHVLKGLALSKDLANDASTGQSLAHGLQSILKKGQSWVDERGTEDNDQVTGRWQELGIDLSLKEFVGGIGENGLLGTLRASVGQDQKRMLAKVGDAVPALSRRRGDEASLLGGAADSMLLEEEVELGGGGTDTYGVGVRGREREGSVQWIASQGDSPSPGVSSCPSLPMCVWHAQKGPRKQIQTNKLSTRKTMRAR